MLRIIFKFADCVRATVPRMFGYFVAAPAPRHNTRRCLAMALCFFVNGCARASMSQLAAKSPDGPRTVCQEYVNDASSFIGQQQGWGVFFASVAVTAGAAGAVVSNTDDGGLWNENKKTILLTTAIPAALLAYNFLNNASSAATSASQASIALSDPDDPRMWVGCQRARSAYFDGRLASISATTGALNGKGTTPQAKELEAYSTIAGSAASQAAQASQNAQSYVAAAREEKAPTTEGPSLDNLRDAAARAASAEQQAAAAATEAKSAVDAGNLPAAEEASRRAKEAKDRALKAAQEAADAKTEYLKK